MAHDLQIGGVENRIEAAFALQPGWHGLGTTLDYVPNSSEMIKAAGLDWKVSMRALFFKRAITEFQIDPEQPDFELAELPGKLVTVRDDTQKPLGVVSDNYGLVQNRDAFDFLDSLQQDGIVKYESAGALKGGRIVWVLAKMPTVDQIADGDDCNRFVLFSTSHDGSACLHAVPTSVRVVCGNTFRAAVANDVGFRHIGDMTQKIDFLRKYVSQFDPAFTLYRNNAQRLAKTPLDRDKATAYIAKLFPEVPELKAGKPNKAFGYRESKLGKIRSNFRNERNALPSIRGTWWALVNSITENVDHQSTFKGEGRVRGEARMLSTIDGDGADFKNRAFDLAVEMSGVGSKTIITV